MLIFFKGICLGILGFSLVFLSYMDLKKRLIPNACVWGVALAGLGWSFGQWPSAFLMSLLLLGIGIALKYGFEYVRQEPCLGLGDVKLMGASGFWLAPGDLPVYFCGIGMSGVLMGILWKWSKNQRLFPLGPALGLGLIGIVMKGFAVPSDVLTHHDLKPAQGTRAETCVVLLHGYGAEGGDLIELGVRWQPDLPTTYFYAPSAPFPFEGGPFGRQWFSLKEWSLPALRKGAMEARPFLKKMIEDLERLYGIPPHRIVLVGFSQGATVALDFALHASLPFAGVISYSGVYLPVESSPLSKPPVLLVHGTSDDVVPVSNYTQTKKNLESLGIPVEGVLIEGLPHSINGQGLEEGRLFIKKTFKTQ